MSAPDILEPTGTQTDGTGQKWGGPNAKHAAQLLKGTHATQKIQPAAIAGTAATLTGNETLNNKTIVFADNTLTNVASTNTAQTITSKTMDATSNTFTGLMHTPDIKRLGGFIGGSTVSTGFGFLTGGIGSVGTGSANVVNADGKSINYATGTTTGNQAGHRGGVSGSVVRAIKPRFKCRFRINTTSLVRFYAGFQHLSAGFVTGEDPFNAANGIVLFLGSADTVFQIARNSGTGATTISAAAGSPAKNNSIHTFELRALDDDTGWEYSFDGAAFTSVTTLVPGSTTVQYPILTIETNESGVAKDFDFWYWFVETAK